MKTLKIKLNIYDEYGELSYTKDQLGKEVNTCPISPFLVVCVLNISSVFVDVVLTSSNCKLVKICSPSLYTGSVRFRASTLKESG